VVLLLEPLEAALLRHGRTPPARPHGDRARRNPSGNSIRDPQLRTGTQSNRIKPDTACPAADRVVPIELGNRIGAARARIWWDRAAEGGGEGDRERIGGRVPRGEGRKPSRANGWWSNGVGNFFFSDCA